MAAQTTILLYGRDVRLLDTRQKVLEKSGARVWAKTEPEEFTLIAPDIEIDLIILCHSLSIEQRGHALAVAHTLWPRVQSLVLTSGDCGRYAQNREFVADVLKGPAYLLHTIANLVGDESYKNSHATSR